MTVSFKKLGAGSSGGEYYLKAASLDDYYLNQGVSDDPDQTREPPGTWFIPGATAPTALHGQAVTACDFRALMGGFHPGTGEVLVRGAGEGHVSGYDFTFSAPKGVSVLWSQVGNEARDSIEAAQQAAAEKALSYLGEHALIARKGAGGKIREHVQPITAMWPHGSSRENDPQLHTHAVVMNLAKCADGVYRTIDPQMALAYQAAIAGVYHIALSDELRRRLGVVCDRRSGEYVFDLAGVPEAVKQAFSKRSDQIAEAAAEISPDALSKAVLAKLALETRDKKDELTRDELRLNWAGEGKRLGFALREAEALLDAVSQQPPPLDSEALTTIVQTVAQRLTATQSVFTEAQLHAALAVEIQVRGTTEDIPRAIAAGEDVLEKLGHEDRGIGVYSTRDMIAIEQRMLALALESAPAHVLRSDVIDAAIAAKAGISETQAAAVRSVCEASIRVSVIEGAPGAGKSFALDAVRDAHERAGYDIHALALSWAAAGVLAEEARASNARAIEGFLRDVEAGRVTLSERSLLLVDEAGLVGSRSMARMLESAAKVGAKVILSGDTRQLKPVDAGGAMLAIVRELPPNRMDEIRRQRDVWQREAVLELGQGKAAEALARYEAQDCIHIAETKGAACDALLASWRADRSTGHTSLILCMTNDEAAALNTRARSLLRAEGNLRGDDVVIRTSDMRYSREGAFAVGDQIQFRQNDPGMAVVDGFDRKGGVYNRTRGTITGIERDVTTGDPIFQVQLDRGGEVRFVSGQSGYWDKERGGVPIQHAYATTLYSSQGLTVDRTHLLWSAAMRRDNAYVGLSRHRDRVAIYADAKSIHAGMMATAGSDAWRPLASVARPEQIGYIARQMSRASNKVTTLDYLRERAAGVAAPSRVPVVAARAHSEVKRAAAALAWEQQRHRARDIDLPAWLQVSGYNTIQDGRQAWKLATPEGTLRLFRGRDGQWLSTDERGTTDAIGVVQRLEGLEFRAAVQRLSGASLPTPAPVAIPPPRPLALKAPDSTQREAALRYARKELRISSDTLAEALRERFCAPDANGVAFLGFDTAGRIRSIETRQLRPSTIDGKPVTNRSYADSDKTFPPILRGNDREVALVEGGFAALALHDMARREGSEPPTVIMTGGARTLKWQDNPQVQALLQLADTVRVHVENERSATIKVETDAAHAKQREAVIRVRGNAEGVAEVRQHPAYKDVAEANAAAAKAEAERRVAVAAARRAAAESENRHQGPSR